MTPTRLWVISLLGMRITLLMPYTLSYLSSALHVLLIEPNLPIESLRFSSVFLYERETVLTRPSI